MALKVIDRIQTGHKKRSLSILIVEDHAIVRHALAEAMRTAGYNVFAAAHGRVALQILETVRIHVVFLDIRIPPPDGYAILEVIQRRKTSWKGFPYSIVISWSNGEGNLRRMKELGANEFLPKPFRVPVVLERVELFKRRLVATDQGFHFQGAAEA